MGSSDTWEYSSVFTIRQYNKDDLSSRYFAFSSLVNFNEPFFVEFEMGYAGKNLYGLYSESLYCYLSLHLKLSFRKENCPESLLSTTLLQCSLLSVHGWKFFWCVLVFVVFFLSSHLDSLGRLPNPVWFTVFRTTVTMLTSRTLCHWADFFFTSFFSQPQS